VVVRTVALMIVRHMLGAVGIGPSPDADAVEIAVLRHQLAVLHRQVPRPRYTPMDRMLLTSLAKLLPRDRWAAFLVTPSTLLRWHRELVARHWTYPHTGTAHRGLDDDVVELVLRLARENPRWATYGSWASAAPSVYACRHPRFAGSFAGTDSGRHLAAAARPGPSSSPPRPADCSHVTCSPWRPSA
jgi:hypothetical protein